MRRILHAVCLATLLSVLYACASTGPAVTELSAPVYTAIRPEAALANEASSVFYRTPPLSGAARSVAEGRYTTFGPDGPHVFVDGLIVTVVELEVAPGPETEIATYMMAFDLGRDRSVRRRVNVDTIRVPRSVAQPGDLEFEDISAAVNGVTSELGLERAETVTLEAQTGEFYTQYQLAIPEHNVYLFLESDLLTARDATHILALAFPDSGQMLAALVDPEAREIVSPSATEPVLSVGEADSEPVRTASPVLEFDDAETNESGVSTVEVPGGVYTGPVVDGRPEGEGRIDYDDGRSYEGGFLDGRFNGRAVLRGPEGDELELTFNEGVPEGAGAYRFGEEGYEVSYSNGNRDDARYLERIVPNYREIQRQRDELTAAIREGLPESAFAENAEAIEGLRAQLDGETGPERLLFQFGIDDQLVEFRLNDDGLVVSRFEEIRVEDDNGELLAIYRSGDRLAVTEQGAALRIAREQIELLEEPRESASFQTLVGGGGVFVGSSVRRAGANFGFDFRSMNNSGEPLPGASGGAGGGWDYRAAVRSTADYQRIEYDFGDDPTTETEFRLSVNGAAGIGRTSYTFDAINRDTLEQEGSGRTWGLQLLFNFELVRPEPPPPPPGLEFIPGGELILSAYEALTRRWRFYPSPFFSVETYRYAPGSVQLESRVTEFQLLIGGGLGLFVTTTLSSF